VHPRATLQEEHKAQDATLYTPGLLFRRNTKLRMRVSAPQGNSLVGAQASGQMFVNPRATLQPGHRAQDMFLCIPELLFSRDTKLRMRVCVP
jgi:hypothetical protein